MNHFISGIIKIVLLEASLALLLLDLAAGDRFEKARARAHGLLAGLMVFAWCNYGSLRHNIDPVQVLTSVPLILLSGWLIQFGFDPAREERFARFTAWARENPSAVSRRAGWLGAIAAVVVGINAGWFPQGDLFGAFLGWKFMAALVVTGIAVLTGRVARGTWPGVVEAGVKRGKVVAVALVVLMSGAWVGNGVAQGRLPLVHQWEQFHFYLGAKYQREVGWFNLYKAAILADRETANALGAMPTTRDLATFEQVPIDVALKDAAEVRARFSDAQWQAFKNDWATMARLWPINWTAVMNDHGNSNSPAWSILAAPIAKLVPLSSRGQALLGWIDLLLMLGLWLAVWQSFGHRIASVGLFIWAAPPIVFDYLSGSFLRWDWLFAVGLAAVFLKQKRYAWAGGFFGFAFATKLFPIFFGVALGLRALFAWRETKEFKREYLRFGVSAAAVGAAAVLVSMAMFGTSAWQEYAKRIQVAQVEKFYAIQYSFRSVYLQHAATPTAAWVNTIFPGELAQLRADVDLCGARAETLSDSQCTRELSSCGDGHRYELNCAASGTCTCAKNGVTTKTLTRELPCAQSTAERQRLFEQECGYPRDFSFGFFLARLLFTVFILVLLRRAEDVEAFLLGPLLVFTWLTVNMYYWNMLGLLALGLLLRASRPRQWPAFAMLLGLHVVFMIFYLYQHLNRGVTEGYAVAWMLTVLIMGTAIAEVRNWRTSQP